MILTNSGVLKLMQRIKSFITAQLNTKANSVHTHSISEIDDLSSLQMGGGGYSKSEVDTLLTGKADSSHTHTKSQITDFPTLSTVATSGSYNDLSNKPAIPTVNNGTLTIQQNGTTVKTFTANAISDVTCNITVPTKTSDLTNDSGFLTSHQSLANYVTLNDAQTIPGNKTFSGLTKTTGKYPYSYSGNDLNNAIYNIETTYWAPDTANRPSTSNYGTILSLNREVNVHTSDAIGWIAQFGIGVDSALYLRTKTNTNNDWSSWKQFITYDEAIPRSGGAVISGNTIGRVDNSAFLNLGGGLNWNNGATISLVGKDANGNNGSILAHPCDGTQVKLMYLNPSGTWTWDGTACQITSDQRLKQQITEIDNKLLDAWEDVLPCQFKYNDAVDQKGDTARLHTGYVVQQINEACQKHDVDISDYGLYCHEEYQERTEEVTIENEDGTTKKETKVVEPAREYYSLRYTETLVVECAYLRRENDKLKQQFKQLEETVNELKNIINCSEKPNS